jgi:CHAT domain-containing protein
VASVDSASRRSGRRRIAGHCWFDPDRPGECGLIFREGVLTSAGFSGVLDGLPVVFSNASETGLLSPEQGAAGVLWTGVAASFLAGGAVNYLGSMWPVFDESSRRIAQFFYERLCAGEPIGEALRQARWMPTNATIPHGRHTSCSVVRATGCGPRPAHN